MNDSQNNKPSDYHAAAPSALNDDRSAHKNNSASPIPPLSDTPKTRSGFEVNPDDFKKLDVPIRGPCDRCNARYVEYIERITPGRLARKNEPSRRNLLEYLCFFWEDVSMARDVSVYSYEIDEAIKSVQTTNRTIIPRYVIEEEIRENRHKYPRAGELPEIPLRMVISELVNRRPDTKIYGKRPVSWAFDCLSSPQGATA